MIGLINFSKSHLWIMRSRRNFINANKIYRIESSLLLKRNSKMLFKKTDYKYAGGKNVNAVENRTWKRSKQMYLSTLLITGIFCTYQVYLWNEKRNEIDFLHDMKEISDGIFDKTDNIVLFVLNKNKIKDQEKRILQVKEEMINLGFTNINYLYTYNDEDTKNYTCFLYKGRRRRMLTEEEFESRERKNIFCDFFKPVSENYEKLNHGNTSDFPIFVTHDTFQTEVIQDSLKNKILLVLFENTCFLCFLYKPFINSLNKLFKENKIELKIKKYNIENNDYAPNMIISRGTPTFLYYHNGRGNKLAEYKPSEIIDKIIEITEAPEDIKNRMLEMSEQIHTRMHHFGHLTIWMTESKLIESMLLQRHIQDKKENIDEENIYNQVMTSLIEEDMMRNDLIEDSIYFIKQKIKEAEKNCYVVAMMMGQELVEEENKK